MKITTRRKDFGKATELLCLEKNIRISFYEGKFYIVSNLREMHSEFSPAYAYFQYSWILHGKTFSSTNYIGPHESRRFCNFYCAPTRA